MPYTLADLDSLDKVIASGAESLQYPDGGGIGYRPMDDLLKARERIVSDLIQSGQLPAGGAGAPGSYVSQSLAVTRRD